MLTAFVLNEGWSQSCKLSLSGHVQDANTNEALIAANVQLKGTDQFLITDSIGNFKFNDLCAGDYILVITHVNCDPVEQKVRLDNSRHIDVYLPHAKETLGEVVVQTKVGTPATGFKKELSGRLLDETRGQSLAESLSRINGVTMLQAGSNISKPVIHGLHSNRILTINNGVRQEGQQWGNEHAPEIDPFIANKLTVIKGVDELKYGSDAIGGVILVEPRALMTQPGYEAEVNAGYFSNNRQYVASAVFEQQLKSLPSLTYRVQGTIKRGANIQTPGYRLNNTATEESNFSATAGWRKKDFNTEVFFSHFATKAGIFTGSHIGNFTDLENAIAADRPDEVFLGQQSYTIGRPYQQVVHDLLKSKSTLMKNGHRFTLLLAGQFDNRKEYDIVRSASNTRPQMDLYINTFSEDLGWESPRTNNFSSLAGISAMQQDNTYSGRYFIPNYFMYSFGGYFIEKWSRHKWELQAGIRADNKNISTERLKFNGDTINHDFHFTTVASSFYAGYKAGSDFKLKAAFVLASRSPHVNELLSDGIHQGTSTYEQGDINLSPEHSMNVSAGIAYESRDRKFSADLDLYANRINDFIYQQPRPDAPVLTISGAYPLLQYVQTDALLTGADLMLDYHITDRLSWTGKGSLLYARNVSLDDWLIGMPANRFSNGVTYNFKNGKRFSDTYVSAEVQQVLKQTRVPDEKNGRQDYKSPPAGYALTSLNLSSTVQLAHLPVTLGVAVKNLFDVRYRDYLNSMRYFTDDMGRNIVFHLRIPLRHHPPQ